MANSGPNFTSKLDKRFKKFKRFGYDTKRIEEESDYEIVRALLDDAWVSIDKCDTEPYNLAGDEIYELTLKYVSLLLEEILTVEITIQKNELKMDSAPGVIFALHKIKTKLEALQSKIYSDLMSRHNYIPLAGIATKREFLNNEDLARHKVRTTFTTPLDLLMKTKLFFQQQNENIKAGCDENWIKYGMTKQYGGLDEFFKQLEEFTHVFQSDASGYDRTAYLLDVYYLRWKFLKYPDELEDLLFWTMFHNIFPFCVALDGTIFMRQCGNNSGANNTASDNSILHLIIVFYLFIYAWRKRHGEFPTISDIEENANLGLYSDDKLGGANFSAFGWDDIPSFQADEMEVYRRFNMVIKPSSILVTENKPGQPIDKKHEFLGSSAAFNELYGKYYGYPRIGKICSSITRQGLEPLTEKEYFHKVMQLLLLSVPEPWLYDKIQEFSQFLIKTSDHKEELKHIEEIYLGKNMNGVLAIHFGYEGADRQMKNFDQDEYLPTKYNFEHKPGHQTQGYLTLRERKYYDDWIDPVTNTVHFDPMLKIDKQAEPWQIQCRRDDFEQHYEGLDRQANFNLLQTEAEIYSFIEKWTCPDTGVYMCKIHIDNVIKKENDLRIREFWEKQEQKQNYEGHDRQSRINFTTIDAYKVLVVVICNLNFNFFLFSLIYESGGWKDLKMIILILNMARVTRAEKMLANLAASPRCELSKDGMNYVKQRFDPYHDLPMKPVGYPDGYAGSTVARCIKKSITVSATSGGGGAPDTTWDCHIYDTPIEKPVLLTPDTGGSNNLFLDSGITPNSSPYGGIMIHRTDNGVWGYPAGPGDLVGQLSLSDNDLKNVMRITASGFEVIDQTAELYKQGTLTAYRQNQQQSTPQTYIKIASGSDTSPQDNKVQVTTGQIFKFPPTTVASAMLIPNTKQWLVKEGAYVVTDYNSDEIPMVEPTFIEPVLIPDNQEVFLDNTTPLQTKFMPRKFQDAHQLNQLWTFGSSPIINLYERWTRTDANRFTPKNQSGVMLTGLNPQATITINKIWYVECAPAGEDEELLSLCSQSPEDDPVALKIIAALRRDSPVAVKLYENYMGEWFFNGIKDLVNKTMPWLSNAQVVGNQIVKWIDSANTNDGYITPQSFVKGPVAPKVAMEKPGKTAIVIKKGPPAPPKGAPKGAAFRPTVVNIPKKNQPRMGYMSGEGLKLTKKQKRMIRARIAAKAAQGGYKSTLPNH